jgi:hypothetical protein
MREFAEPILKRPVADPASVPRRMDDSYGSEESAHSPRLCVVVCANGLGHFRRSIRVVDALHTQLDELEVEIYAEQWQVERARGWSVLARLQEESSVRFHCGAMHGSPQWDRGGWTARDYFGWVEAIGREEPVQNSDIVLSDNLVGVLRARPDAILMGSFLWHDVLRAEGPDGPRIAAFEEKLLAEALPPMLCVGDMVMPEVERLTRAVRLPWFCEAGAGRTSPSWPLRRVLLSGGATDSVSPGLHALAALLLQRSDLTLLMPERLISADLLSSGRVEPFDFSAGAFGACDLVIGRPGIGLLTDCVGFGIPILALGDEENIEIRHNARRVEALGIGREIALGEPISVARALREELTETEYAVWKRNLLARPRGGAARAAQFISRQLKQTHADA